MNLLSAWRKVRWSLTRRGWKGTLQAIPAALRRSRREAAEPVHPFDQRYGTETGGVLGGGSLATGQKNDAHITAYAGVAPSRLNAALDRWMETLVGERLEDFAFVDLGCGKGRALLLASERDFRQVLGIELNRALAETTERNAILWESLGRRRAPMMIRQGDATEIVYPEGHLLVFLYNPFGAPVMKAVTAQLHAHVRATGARVDLLFQNETPEMPMRNDPGLQQVWSLQLPLVGEDLAAELVGSPTDVTSLYRFCREQRPAEAGEDGAGGRVA